MRRIFTNVYNKYINLETVNCHPERIRKLDKLITDNVKYKGSNLFYKVESIIML